MKYIILKYAAEGAWLPEQHEIALAESSERCHRFTLAIDTVRLSGRFRKHPDSVLQRIRSALLQLSQNKDTSLRGFLRNFVD